MTPRLGTGVVWLMEMPSAEFSSNRNYLLARPGKIEKPRRELASGHISFAVDITL